MNNFVKSKLIAVFAIHQHPVGMKTFEYLLGLFIVLGMAVPVFADDDSDGDDKNPKSVVGVWVCTAIRPQSGTFQLIHNFHHYGTMNYSSGSDLFNAGYSSRGGGQGKWRKVDHSSLFRYVAIENLNENKDEGDGAGNRDKKAGTFYVDSTFYFDRDSDTICTGTGMKEPDASCKGIVPSDLEEDVVTKLRRKGTLNNPSPGGNEDLVVGAEANVSWKCNRLEAHLLGKEIFN